MESIQASEIEVTTVHHVVTAWKQGNLVERCHFVPFSLGKSGESRNIAAQAEQHIELHGCQMFFPASPGEQRHAQLDDGSVECEQIRLQSKLRHGVHIQPLGSPHENVGYLGEDPPIPMVVGISQVRSGDPSAKSHAVRDGWSRAQTSLDSTQALPVCELRKNHRRKVVVNRHRARRSWHRKSSSNAGKFRAVQPCYDLRKDRVTGVHADGHRGRLCFCQSKCVTRSSDSFCQSFNWLHILNHPLTGQPCGRE